MQQVIYAGGFMKAENVFQVHLTDMILLLSFLSKQKQQIVIGLSVRFVFSCRGMCTRVCFKAYVPLFSTVPFVNFVNAFTQCPYVLSRAV